MWKRSDIDNNRVKQIPQLTYVVIGFDPAVTSKSGSDDTGIMAAGKGTDGHGYILGDYTVQDTPQKWGEAAITAYHKHKANKIVGEANNGGDLVETNIKAVDSYVKFESVHASRGKATRAEPISALYEQGKVHHFGTFPELEDQMCSGSLELRNLLIVWMLLSGRLSNCRIALTFATLSDTIKYNVANISFSCSRIYKLSIV